MDRYLAALLELFTEPQTGVDQVGSSPPDLLHCQTRSGLTTPAPWS
jgi:hypothetical protein